MKIVNSNWRPDASSTVTVYAPGAVVSATASNSATVTVRAGHGFAANDYLFKNTDVTATFQVTGIAATTLTVSPNITASVDDVLTNVGADTYTSNTLDWDGSPISIYTESSFASSAITNARVTANSDGEYSYHMKGDGRAWEVIRNSSGTFIDVIQGWSSVSGRYNVGDFGTTQVTIDAAENANGVSTIDVTTPIITFTSTDTTPSVYGANAFKTAGTTAITNFDDGLDGQVITILAESTITITHGASTIILDNAANFAMVSGDTLTVSYDSTNWREVSRTAPHEAIITFDNADATPTVALSHVFKTQGTTAITNFLNGYNGQVITVFAESSITITHGASTIILWNESNFAMLSGDTITLAYDSTNWRELSRTPPGIDAIITLQSGSATPSVLGGTVFKTAGTTAISDFTNGIAGQVIVVLAETSITLTDSADLILNGGTDFGMVSEDAIILVYDGTNWRESGRNNVNVAT